MMTLILAIFAVFSFITSAITVTLCVFSSKLSNRDGVMPATEQFETVVEPQGQPAPAFRS